MSVPIAEVWDVRKEVTDDDDVVECACHAAASEWVTHIECVTNTELYQGKDTKSADS